MTVLVLALDSQGADMQSIMWTGAEDAIGGSTR